MLICCGLLFGVCGRIGSLVTKLRRVEGVHHRMAPTPHNVACRFDWDRKAREGFPIPIIRDVFDFFGAVITFYKARKSFRNKNSVLLNKYI